MTEGMLSMVDITSIEIHPIIESGSGSHTPLQVIQHKSILRARQRYTEAARIVRT